MYYITFCSIISCHITLYYVMSYGITSYDTIWYDIIWHYMILCDIISIIPHCIPLNPGVGPSFCAQNREGTHSSEFRTGSEKINFHYRFRTQNREYTPGSVLRTGRTLNRACALSAISLLACLPSFFSLSALRPVFFLFRMFVCSSKMKKTAYELGWSSPTSSPNGEWFSFVFWWPSKPPQPRAVVQNPTYLVRHFMAKMVRHDGESG